MNKRKTVYALISLIITLFACALLAIFLYPDMFLDHHRLDCRLMYHRLALYQITGHIKSELWGLRLI